MSTLGWIHVLFGILALITGTAVLLAKKGTRYHRIVGRIYVFAMVALNVSGLFIFDLFGTFGPFHYMAVASLLTLVVAMIPVYTKRPKGMWMEWHGAWIAGSYVGLIAATASEFTSRLPGGWNSFSGPVTAVTTIVIIGVGVFLINRNLQKGISLNERTS